WLATKFVVDAPFNTLKGLRALAAQQSAQQQGSRTRKGCRWQPFPCAAERSALVQRNVVATVGAGVQLARTTDLLTALDDFLPVRDPAHGTGHGEDHGEHAGRNADGLQDDARVEVHVRVQVAL